MNGMPGLGFFPYRENGDEERPGTGGNGAGEQGDNDHGWVGTSWIWHFVFSDLAFTAYWDFCQMPLCVYGFSTPQPVLKGFAAETLALWQPEFGK